MRPVSPVSYRAAKRTSDKLSSKHLYNMVYQIEVQEKSIEAEKSSTAAGLSTEEFIKRRKERAARMREAKKLTEKSEPFANSDVSNAERESR